MKDDILKETFIDHEIRIRIQERTAHNIQKLLRWILATTIGTIIIPMILKYNGLT